MQLEEKSKEIAEYHHLSTTWQECTHPCSPWKVELFSSMVKCSQNLIKDESLAR